MQRYVFIPGNLDVRELVHKYPPQIPNFTLEKLLQIIHQVFRQRSYKKWKVYDGFVQIKNNSFYSIADDYLLYLKYLQDVGVLLCDYQARPQKKFPDDPKSYGYKFTPLYNGSFALFPLSTLTESEKRTIRKRKKPSKSALLKEQAYQRLRSEYSFIKYLDDLRVDFDAATNTLLDLQYGILKDSTLSDTDKEKAVFKLSTYGATLEQFRRMASKEVAIDKTGLRLHSPLTRLKKEMRFYLTYKGEHLVSLDLKNSQPYFSLALTELSFWVDIIDNQIDGRTRKGANALAHPIGRRLFIDSNSTKGRLKKFLNIWELYPQHAALLQEALIQKRTISNSPISPSTDGEKESESESTNEGWRVAGHSILAGIRELHIEGQLLAEFRKDVAEGEIYEKLISSLEKIFAGNSNNVSYLTAEGISWNSDPAIQRKAVKSLMVRAMFAPNGSKKPITRIAVEMLSCEYPQIEWLYRRIRHGNYKVLAHLLQRIESFVLLKACTRAIVNRNKHIPFWTIHDSIITTPKYCDDVKKIMKETIADYIGVEPEIKPEHWSEYKPEKINLFEVEPEEFLHFGRI